MHDSESTLRRRLRRYLDAVEPTSVSGVMGVCLTGSLAAGFGDAHSDIDLTVVLEGNGTATDPERLSETLLPESATVHRHAPLEKYSFDWNEGHIDVDVIPYSDLQSDCWDMETRWEYDNAEVLVDPSGRLESHLTDEVAFADGEQAALIEQYADEFLFTAQWDVHKACLRESYWVAHRAVTRSTDDALALLYLQAGEFVPRDKWILAGLDTVGMDTEEIRGLVWDATRVTARDAEDVHRRVRALHALWNRLEHVLVEQGFVESDSLSWEAPPDELCLIE